MKNHVQKTKQKGSIAVEYMALSAFVGLGLIIGAKALGGAINNGLEGIGTNLTEKRIGDILDPGDPGDGNGIFCRSASYQEC